MHIDHVYPRILGGMDVIDNFVLTSSVVNLKKSDKIDETLVERMLYLNKIAYAPKMVALYNRLCPDIYLTIGRSKLKPYLLSGSLYNQQTYPHFLGPTAKRLDSILLASKGKDRRWFKVEDLDRFFSTATLPWKTGFGRVPVVAPRMTGIF